MSKTGATRRDRMAKARVLIVDDHPTLRQGLGLLIGQHEDLLVCGGAEDVHSGIEAVETLHPDVVLVDISLKDSNGLDLIKHLKASRPDLPTLVLSMHDETLYASRALRAGAMGYVMKEEATDRVVTAIRQVLAGKVYLSDRMADRVVEGAVKGEASVSPVARLSDRELEIFSLMGHGLGTREIAEKTHLSIKTIETHKARIKVKLQIRDASTLSRRAIEWVREGG